MPSLNQIDTAPLGSMPKLPGTHRIDRSRWVILALLFAATTINYIDRQLIGLLKPTLSHDLGWTDTDYANIIFVFQAAYAISYLALGRLLDWIGVRFGFALAVTVWSVGAALHGVVSSVTGFAAARFALGMGEGGYLPACIKTVRLWFPPQERGFATGVFNAGITLGALVTPVLVPWIVAHVGWRLTFVMAGAVGLLWLAPWLTLYRDPANVEAGAVAEPTPPWRIILGWRATWAYAAIQFLTSPIWWFYLFWLPDFLHRAHGIDLASMGPPLVAVYVIAMAGSLAGGWLSSALIRRGMPPLRARKSAMLLAAFCVTPVVMAGQVHGLWSATLLVALAASAHQAWASNMFTLPGDVVPVSAIGAVSGFGGMLGAVGGMFVAKLAGAVLTATNSYITLFSLIPAAYFLALILLHLLLPTRYDRSQA